MSKRGFRLSYGASVTIPLQLILVLLLMRCFQLQVLEGARYSRQQTASTTASDRLEGSRGRIVTRDGVVLAQDVPYWKVAIDPTTAGGRLRDPIAKREPRLRQLLRRAFAETKLVPRANEALLERQAIRRLRDGKYFYFLGTIESIEDYDDFVAWKAASGSRRVFTLEERSRREYPRGDLASQIVGPRGSFQEYWGIETWLNRSLHGRDGLRRVDIDGRRKPYHTAASAGVEARPGDDVVITIDSRIQRLLETRVQSVYEKFKARAVSAVIVDPHTGSILAIVSAPGFGTEDEWTGQLTDEQLRRRSAPQITQLAYEPGSTIKGLILCEAITRGVDRDMIVKPEEGRSHVFKLGRQRRVITDVSYKGPLTVDESVIYSSNIGMAKLGQWLGREGLASCLRRFELGQRTGFELPEEGGVTPLAKNRKWRPGTTLSVAFGYELLVTPLQMVKAYCAIANGGYRVQPHVVAAVGDSDRRHRAGERILRPDVVREVKKVLRKVVEVGLKEEVDTINLAGKTGTAKKITRDPVTGKAGYDGSKYRGSFIGFAPVDNPRFLMMMIVDEPQGEKYYGGAVARPAVLRTLTDLLDTDQGFFQAAVERSVRGSQSRSDEATESSKSRSSDAPPERRPDRGDGRERERVR